MNAVKNFTRPRGESRDAENDGRLPRVPAWSVSGGVCGGGEHQRSLDGGARAPKAKPNRDHQRTAKRSRPRRDITFFRAEISPRKAKPRSIHPPELTYPENHSLSAQGAGCVL